MTENDKIMTDNDLYIGPFMISAPWPILWVFIAFRSVGLVQSAPGISLWPTSLCEIVVGI